MANKYKLKYSVWVQLSRCQDVCRLAAHICGSSSTVDAHFWACRIYHHAFTHLCLCVCLHTSWSKYWECEEIMHPFSLWTLNRREYLGKWKRQNKMMSRYGWMILCDTTHKDNKENMPCSLSLLCLSISVAVWSLPSWDFLMIFTSEQGAHSLGFASKLSPATAKTWSLLIPCFSRSSPHSQPQENFETVLSRPRQDHLRARRFLTLSMRSSSGELLQPPPPPPGLPALLEWSTLCIKEEEASISYSRENQA